MHRQSGLEGSVRRQLFDGLSLSNDEQAVPTLQRESGLNPRQADFAPADSDNSRAKALTKVNLGERLSGEGGFRADLEFRPLEAVHIFFLKGAREQTLLDVGCRHACQRKCPFAEG